MAYATTEQLRIAAGGSDSSSPALLEISNSEDAETLAMAKAAADSEIDAHARRLYSAVLPFGSVSPYLTVPDKIATLAADIAVYKLREWKRMLGERDIEAQIRREQVIYPALDAGTYIPVPDSTYPLGSPGVPSVTSKTSTGADATRTDSVMTRDSLKGYW